MSLENLKSMSSIVSAAIGQFSSDLSGDVVILNPNSGLYYTLNSDFS
jgi:hypothetical protein